MKTKAPVSRHTPAWMTMVLRIAAVYNLLYAIALSIWPGQIFNWLRMPDTPNVMIQCVGMIIGVYALAYWITAQDLLRYWPLVITGLAGKTLGPLGFLYNACTGVFVWRSGLFVLFSDLIWWVPFWWMSVYAFRHRHEWEVRCRAERTCNAGITG